MTKDTQHNSSEISTVDAEKLQALAKRSFDESLDLIDGETLSKLRRVRATALESAQPKKTFLARAWLPSGALAMAASILLVILVVNQQSSDELIQTSSLAQIGMESTAISSNDDEFLYANTEPWQEDEELLDELDFLTWLTVEEEFAG